MRTHRGFLSLDRGDTPQTTDAGMHNAYEWEGSMTTPDPAHRPQNVELAAAYRLPIKTVDDAITGALEHARLVEGWNGIPDLNPIIWNYISSDVLRTLDDHVEMGEAA